VVAFDYLARHPEHAEQLARLHFAEWGGIFDGWSVDLALAGLISHAVGPTLPTTIVALDEQQHLLGSASLLDTDADQLRDFTPWLASVFVLPEHRHNGIGRALVDRVADEARALNVATLYLFTTRMRQWYLDLGWQEIARRMVQQHEVCVMSLDLRWDARRRANA
jgi:GNAT superfamily N-acetyltransferase